MSRKDVYILTKDGGSLFSAGLGDTTQIDGILVSGFLSAVNSFSAAMGWPSGVSLVRSGSIECRIWPGKDIFLALAIDTKMNLGNFTEHLVEDLARVICERFEAKYPAEIKKAIEDKFTKGQTFADFQKDVQDIMNQFKSETTQLYQKLILIEAMYANVPQKWCVPLIEMLTAGKPDVTNHFERIRKMYPQLKKAVEKVNSEQALVWELFGISLYQFS